MYIRSPIDVAVILHDAISGAQQHISKEVQKSRKHSDRRKYNNGRKRNDTSRSLEQRTNSQQDASAGQPHGKDNLCNNASIYSILSFYDDVV